MSGPERKRVLDPERDGAALKALTHPLRIRLLGLLRQHGAATATELAGLTGESSASTSYHLRVLAKYDFVAEAEHRDGRERRWQAVDDVTAWSNTAMGATPERRARVDVTRRAQLDHLERSLAQHEADLAAGRLSPEWREVAAVSDRVPRLTADSLAELWACFAAKLEELTIRDQRAEETRQVVVLAAGVPLADRDATRDDTGGGNGADGRPGADPEIQT
ncbi:winged helix-turn-helix domain-containing protein [Streptomyces sp. DSM 42041]|uniref:Winged helix-turn-helix domain-containing protein n=1 Tax=Streptomyces hazeniae TaxID=3075538 RepID=A0ABU2NVT9_9ACTN|nr:winged helix-turn-helix domain-containing protein [Streptomyces sp. DSM 42041]MDT0381106.1 winged helix-turn-helix domain-containing protein [Streptomyces sp. DSM 42041]